LRSALGPREGDRVLVIDEFKIDSVKTKADILKKKLDQVIVDDANRISRALPKYSNQSTQD
jgi:hypothetical protein